MVDWGIYYHAHHNLYDSNLFRSQGKHMTRNTSNFTEQSTLCSTSLRWRHNGHDSVSNHQPHDCSLNRLFGRRSKKHQSCAPLASVWGIHRGPMNSPHKWPITRKMFPFDDVIMYPYRPMCAKAASGFSAKMFNVTDRDLTEFRHDFHSTTRWFIWHLCNTTRNLPPRSNHYNAQEQYHG